MGLNEEELKRNPVRAKHYLSVLASLIFIIFYYGHLNITCLCLLSMIDALRSWSSLLQLTCPVTPHNPPTHPTHTKGKKKKGGSSMPCKLWSTVDKDTIFQKSPFGCESFFPVSDQDPEMGGHILGDFWRIKAMQELLSLLLYKKWEKAEYHI